jgi:hypothetical protein
MAPQNGRTSKRYNQVWIDNAAGTLTRLIGIDDVPDTGMNCDITDLTALNDASKGGLPGIPDYTATYTGIWNTTDHTTLIGITNGVTPLSFDVRNGIRQTWEAGEPQFGITSDASNGVLVHSYKTNFQTYSFTVYMFAGSAAPAWGTVAET